MATLTAVDNDPFAQGQTTSASPKLTPVDHDPFAKTTLTPVDHDPFAQGGPSYTDDVKKDYDNMDAYQQKLADQVADGSVNKYVGAAGQGLAETRLLTAPVNEAIAHTPIIGDALRGIGRAGSAALHAMPLGNGTIASQYDKTMQNNPNLAAVATGAGDALNALPIPSMGGAAASIGGKLATGAKVAIKDLPDAISDLRTPTDEEVAASQQAATDKAAQAATAAKVADAPKTTADWAKDAGESYDYANYRNETFKPETVTDPFVAKMQAAKSELLPNGVQTPEQGELNTFIDTLSGMKGAPISLSQVDTLDKALADKVAAHTDPTGAMDSTGNTLNGLKKDLRSLVMGVDTTGNDALHNGRVAWATRSALRDLDIAEDNADVAGGSQSNYQSQYRRLYKDRDNTGTWPQEAQDALYGAAKPSLADRLTGNLATHVTAGIAAATGHVGAAGLVEGAKAGFDAMKGGIAAGKGQAIRDALIKNAAGKMKDVDYTPQPQLQLPAPDGSAGFSQQFTPPMSDTAVNIAQKKASMSGTAAEANPTIDKTAMLKLAPPDKMTPLNTPPMSDSGVGIAQRLMNNPPVRAAEGTGVATPDAPLNSRNIASRLKRKGSK